MSSVHLVRAISCGAVTPGGRDAGSNDAGVAAINSKRGPSSADPLVRSTLTPPSWAAMSRICASYPNAGSAKGSESPVA